MLSKDIWGNKKKEEGEGILYLYLYPKGREKSDVFDVVEIHKEKAVKGLFQVFQPSGISSSTFNSA